MQQENSLKVLSRMNASDPFNIKYVYLGICDWKKMKDNELINMCITENNVEISTNNTYTHAHIYIQGDVNTHVHTYIHSVLLMFLPSAIV